MANEKKISPNEVGLEVGLVLSKFFFKTEHLHFGFWPDDLEISVDNLKKSQDYHSEKIINSIPSDVSTILDVGSGSGGLAKPPDPLPTSRIVLTSLGIELIIFSEW